MLVCVHLHYGVAVGSNEAPWCKYRIQANLTAITQRTGTEALNAISIVRCYLGNCTDKSHQIVAVSPDKVNECGNISLIPPGSELQGTANAFSNLNKLLHMYRSVFIHMELYDSTFTETESAKLDMLETVFSRLSNQVERYLQVRRCSCSDIQCTVQGIDKNSTQEEIQELQSDNCTPRISLNVIMRDLRIVATDTLNSLPGGSRAYSIRSYQLCRSLKALPTPCNTTQTE